MIRRLLLPSVLIGLLVLVALFGPLLMPYDPQYIEVSSKLLPPSQLHWLGTDQLGRDILSRLVSGARFSLFLSLVITLLELLLGGLIGLLVGWYQGKLEAVFLWLANVVSSFPSFLLSLATAGILGQGIFNLMVSIILVEWLFYARLVANIVKTAKQEPYVIAAKTMGLPTRHILKKHILPFVYQPILVLALMNIGNIILMISGFSFLGIGVQPNIAEWGMMLYDARVYFRTATWMMLAPGCAIFLTVLSFNVLSEALDQWRKSHGRL